MDMAVLANWALAVACRGLACRPASLLREGMPQEVVVALGELPSQTAAGGTGGAALALAGDDADAAQACREPGGARQCTACREVFRDAAQACTANSAARRSPSLRDNAQNYKASKSRSWGAWPLMQPRSASGSAGQQASDTAQSCDLAPLNVHDGNCRGQAHRPKHCHISSGLPAACWQATLTGQWQPYLYCHVACCT